MAWAADEFTGKRFGKYEVLCRLAIGGMAEIFLAFPRAGDHVGRPVVLKRILADQREDEHALQMLLDEAKLTATLNHLNVARVLDLEVVDEEVLLVIEFIGGANMEELVASYAEQKEVVPFGLALTVVREAAAGLAHAHAHLDKNGRAMPIVHRDVTPRNIMVSFDGVTKMLDFGIARAMGMQRRTMAGMVRGTTAYMSPEQAIGKDVNPQSDIFSLGVIFHELLTGQRLFARGNPGEEMAAVYEGEIPPPSKVNRRVPKPLDAVVMRALERGRVERYESGLDLIRDIALVAGSTAWSYERCADAVRERFADRQRSVDKLIGLIPLKELGVAPPPPPPSSDEARTLIATRTSKLYTDEPGADTTMDSGPHDDAGNGPSLRATDPARAAVPPEAKPQRPRLGKLPAELLDTQPGGSKAVAKKVVSTKPKPSQPTELFNHSNVVISKPRRSSEAADAGGSRAMLAIVGLVAIVVGVLVGVVISKQLGSTNEPVTEMGRLSITTDTKAELFIGDQSLGFTPVTGLILPAGPQHLTVKGIKGERRFLKVIVLPMPQPTVINVKVNELQEVQ